MRSLLDYVMNHYRDVSYEQKGKVRTLFTFEMVLIPSLTIIIIGMNIIAPRPLFDSFNVTIGGLLIVVIISWAFLILGFYNLSANLLLMMAVIGLMLNCYGTTFKGSQGRFIGAFMPLLAAIVLSSLFTTIRMFFVTIFIITAGSIYILMTTDLVAGEVRGIIIFDIIITIFLVSLLSFLIVRINTVARRLRRDETSRDMKEQADINRDLMHSLQEVALNMDVSSNDMLSKSDSFAGNLQNQAASIEEITATIEEISSGAENVSDHVVRQTDSIKSLNSRMSDLYSLTRDMEQRIAEALNRTEYITGRAHTGESHVSEMNDSMSTINETSGEMMGILRLINEISEQINLLSLNASIEAARAGDAGRGFAVVADEVSKLADQTASSVKDIDRLIKNSEAEVSKGIDNVGDAVSVMKEIIGGVGEINEMIEAISGFMSTYLQVSEEVNSESGKVSQLSDEIRTASEEQKKAAGEIVRSITGINEMSQSNTSWSEDITHHSRMISEMAADLKSRIGEFNERFQNALKLEEEDNET